MLRALVRNSLPVDYDDLARLNRGQLMKNSRDQRPNVLHAVAKSFERDYPNPDSFHVLLKFKARIVGDEHFKSGVDGSSEQHAVAQAEPALCTDRRCLVANELWREVAWETLVNE